MDLEYGDLTEEIINICFEVYNELGWGYREQYYERAFLIELERRGIQYNSQVTVPVMYKNKKIGSNRFDILVDNKILIEFKVGAKLIKTDYDQINEYLRKHEIRNGLLILFSPRGVVPKRVFNNPEYCQRYSN